MPTLIAALLGGLIQIVGTLVGKVLVSLGIGYVAFSGIDSMLDLVKRDSIGLITQLPPLAVQLAGVLNIGICINIIVSAYLARLTIRGLTSGTVTKLVHK